MCQILKKVYDVDPNNSDAVKDALTSFFQHLPKHKDVEKSTWLRALEIVITRYPKYCASHRNNIEVYLCSYLDTYDYHLVVSAAKCTHAVQQIRLAQDRAATPKSCWRGQINLLCKAAHVLIDAIFENAVDMYKGISDNKTPALSSTFSNALNQVTKVPNNVNKKSFLQVRLRNILIFIQAMLVEIYPVAKPVEPHIILDLVLRAQSVTSVAKINQRICDVKIEALRTLDALIVCLGSNLIPFSLLVVRFVMQTLRWSSDNPSEEASKVRCGAYNSLRGWLTAVRCHRAGEHAWEDQLTGHVLGDVTPQRHVVQLTIGAQPIKHLSKKARRKQANAMLKESSIAAHMPGEKNKIHVHESVNNEVAMAALNCAEMFLTVCGRFLKPTTHKIYQERIIRECYTMDSYDDEQLLAMLRVLEASRKTTPSGVPPPTQYCLHLYSVLLNRQNNEISKFCTQALLDIRLHLHCSPPSLNFNLEAPVQEQNDTSKRKTVSDKNRAALESLLGQDRVSQLDDEIIVPDEPSSKKPRIEENTENISVSSASNQSIEISDESDDDVEEVEVVAEINNMSTNEDQVDKPIVIEQIETSKPAEIEIVANDTENTLTQKNNNATIHEAATQAPLNVSTETFESDDRPLSMEVSYDYPNTGTEIVAILEKEDDNNLPSTNETDDVQITCGQVMKLSQEMVLDKVSTTSIDENVESKMNGNVSEEVVENENETENKENKLNLQNGIENIEASKIPSKNDGISVDDMLADFVDEVNEEAIVVQ